MFPVLPRGQGVMRTTDPGQNWRPFRSKCREKCCAACPLPKKSQYFLIERLNEAFFPLAREGMGRQGEGGRRRDGPCVALLFPFSCRRGTGGLGRDCVSRLPPTLLNKSALGRGWGTGGKGEPCEHRQQRATERRPGGLCPLRRRKLRASTAERGAPLPPNRKRIVLPGPNKKPGTAWHQPA